MAQSRCAWRRSTGTTMSSSAHELSFYARPGCLYLRACHRVVCDHCAMCVVWLCVRALSRPCMLTLMTRFVM